MGPTLGRLLATGGIAHAEELLASSVRAEIRIPPDQLTGIPRCSPATWWTLGEISTSGDVKPRIHPDKEGEEVHFWPGRK